MISLFGINLRRRSLLRRRTDILSASGIFEYRFEILLAAGAFMVMLVLGLSWRHGESTTPAPKANPSALVSVVSGDAIWIGDVGFALLGIQAPRAGSDADCEAEQKLAQEASEQLQQLVNQGGVSFTRLPCPCRLGTEGTKACNNGRLCGVLAINGQDVGATLIAKGLARPYVCRNGICPRRGSWC